MHKFTKFLLFLFLLSADIIINFNSTHIQSHTFNSFAAFLHNACISTFTICFFFATFCHPYTHAHCLVIVANYKELTYCSSYHALPLHIALCFPTIVNGGNIFHLLPAPQSMKAIYAKASAYKYASLQALIFTFTNLLSMCLRSFAYIYVCALLYCMYVWCCFIRPFIHFLQCHYICKTINQSINQCVNRSYNLVSSTSPMFPPLFSTDFFFICYH